MQEQDDHDDSMILIYIIKQQFPNFLYHTTIRKELQRIDENQ